MTGGDSKNIMTPERREQIRRSFERLAALPPQERESQLNAIGSQDAELRRELEARLGSDEKSRTLAAAGFGKSSGGASEVTERRRDRVGQTISHYRIEERLGGGGMGVVYKAQDLRLDRYVALKFLPPSVDPDDERLRRLIIEARAASALDHPNICTIHQIEETDDGHWFIVMAYYPGETLKKRIETKPLAISEVVDYGIQVAQGLVKAHKEQIVHRDLKPANLIITPEGVVKIVDFGLAQLVAQTKLTVPGTRLGTPAYMSPEQAQGQIVDHRTDIWSLGVVLYEMLAGRSPFKGEYELAIIYSILNEEPAALRLRRDMPPALMRIINKALSKDPADRHQQAEELLAELQTFQAGGELPSDTRPRTARTLPLRYLYTGIAVCVVVLLVVLWTLRRSSPQPPETVPAPVAAESVPENVPETATPAETSPSGTTAEAPTTPAPITPAPTAPATTPPATAAAPPRVVTPPVAPKTAPPVAPAAQPAAVTASAGPVVSWPPESDRWALIIGVERYTDSDVAPFRGAARDAASLREALVRYAGFPQDQVILLSTSESQELRRPGRANIESYLQNISKLVPKQGLLLFCFLGHAVVFNGQPFLLPADARFDGSGASLVSSGVSLETVRNAVANPGIRQVMILLDAFRQSPRASQGASPNPMEEIYERRLSFDVAGGQVDAFASLFAASPGESGQEQAATGSGYFITAVVDALKGAAADDSGRITLGALDRYVRENVPKRVLNDLGAQRTQRPVTVVAGYQPDEVVIARVARREVSAAQPPEPADSRAQELVEWTRIRDNRDIAVFETFLRAYPDGALRKEALSRIEDLKWDAARGANQPAAVERFLRDYPSGRYTGQAQALLEKLRPPTPPAPAPQPERPQPPADADLIRAVLQRFSEAYEARDVQRVAALWPTLTQEQLRRLADSFRVAVSIKQELRPVAEPNIRGDQATIRCHRSLHYQDERGSQRPVEDEVTVTLRKRPGGWVIEALK